MTDKAALRREAEERRRHLARPDYAERVAAHADRLVIAAGAVVSGYMAFREEADPGQLLQALEQRGHVIALPAIVARAQPLRFHRWNATDALQDHAYGVKEPLGSAEMVVPDVLLVPLLAFDASGFRLGYGGGYYDRTLAALRAMKPILAIGIAYAGQEVDAVPHDGHDQKLDGLLSESGLRNFA